MHKTNNLSVDSLTIKLKKTLRSACNKVDFSMHFAVLTRINEDEMDQKTSTLPHEIKTRIEVAAEDSVDPKTKEEVRAATREEETTNAGHLPGTQRIT